MYVGGVQGLTGALLRASPFVMGSPVGLNSSPAPLGKHSVPEELRGYVAQEVHGQALRESPKDVTKEGEPRGPWLDRPRPPSL